MTVADDLGAFLEALLFVAERPLSTAEVAQLGGVSAVQAEAALAALGEELAGDGRGLRLQRLDDAWQLATAPEVGERLATYAAREEARLSPAALEALAVVAYRQPCTRADVERVRGVDSDYVMRSLLHRRLIAEVGRRDTPGRPILYATTFAFLERFGLTSLDDLPPLSSQAAAATALATMADADTPLAREPADAG
ncbi:MAG TPA: SMC-Scp complex subunit ScpB [Candidatus Limnocylindria bacterium]|nr:SMC-Scp complex subunit ScpB [Candidatus Limnocylindria bacterium]